MQGYIIQRDIGTRSCAALERKLIVAMYNMKKCAFMTITRMARLNLYGSAWAVPNLVHVYSIYGIIKASISWTHEYQLEKAQCNLMWTILCAYIHPLSVTS